MPNKPKKSSVQKLRLFEGDPEIARKIVEKTKLDLIDVYSLACSAGLHAIAENNFEFHMPLRFEVAQGKSQTAGTSYPETQVTLVQSAEDAHPLAAAETAQQVSPRKRKLPDRRKKTEGL